jgi:hypothetical protein
MTTKSYRSESGTQYTFTIKVDKKKYRLTIGDISKKFTTSSVEAQKALEATTYFKNGIIVLDSSVTEERNVSESSKQTVKEFPHVKSVNEAVELLTASPYNAAPDKLRTPDQVRSQAAMRHISFPNWKN